MNPAGQAQINAMAGMSVNADRIKGLQAVATAQKLNYENRQIALNSAAATLAIASLYDGPFAPVSTAGAVALSFIAFADKIVVEGGTVDDLVLQALTLLPLGRALKEIDSLEHLSDMAAQSQAILSAGVSASAVAQIQSEQLLKEALPRIEWVAYPVEP